MKNKWLILMLVFFFSINVFHAIQTKNTSSRRDKFHVNVLEINNLPPYITKSNNIAFNPPISQPKKIDPVDEPLPLSSENTPTISSTHFVKEEVCFDTSDCCSSYDYYPSYNQGIYGNLFSITTFGEGMGNIRSYETVGGLLGQRENNFFSFLQLQGLLFDNNYWGVSSGIGVRCLHSRTGNIWGVNVFYDYKSGHHTDFNQGGVGIEFFGCYFDFFANYYSSLGRKRHRLETITYYYPDGYFAAALPYVSSFSGGDFEVGTSTSKWKNSPWDLYVGMGGYHYDPVNSAGSSFTGGRYRAEISWYEFVTIGVVGTYDSIFRNKVQAYIGITIPFDLCTGCYGIQNLCNDWADKYFYRPAHRNSAILQSNSCCSWQTNY